MTYVTSKPFSQQLYVTWTCKQNQIKPTTISLLELITALIVRTWTLLIIEHQTSKFDLCCHTHFNNSTQWSIWKLYCDGFQSQNSQACSVWCQQYWLCLFSIIVSHPNQLTIRNNIHMIFPRIHTYACMDLWFQYGLINPRKMSCFSSCIKHLVAGRCTVNLHGRLL